MLVPLLETFPGGFGPPPPLSPIPSGPKPSAIDRVTTANLLCAQRAPQYFSSAPAASWMVASATTATIFLTGQLLRPVSGMQRLARYHPAKGFYSDPNFVFLGGGR